MNKCSLSSYTFDKNPHWGGRGLWSMYLGFQGVSPDECAAREVCLSTCKHQAAVLLHTLREACYG